MNEFSRRNFLKGCLATTIAFGNGLGAAELKGQEQDKIPSKKLKYTHIVYDEFFGKSIKFAKELKGKSDTKIYSIDNDVSKIYSGLKNDLIKNKNSVLVGLTSYASFFVLQNIAKDYGFIPFYIGTHNITNDKDAHLIQVSKSMSHKIQKSLENSDWTTSMAKNLQSLILDKDLQTIAINRQNLNKTNELFYSWIIAHKNNKGEMI